jgi:Co/Zn/Cd efflux system component
MIALLIGYEAISRFFEPVSIYFAEAIPLAILGLAVNVASAWLLGGGDHHHGHDHSHDDHDHAHGAAHRDNNMRAAVVHVLAGLLLARVFGWLWMDPLAGLVGDRKLVLWVNPGHGRNPVRYEP